MVVGILGKEEQPIPIWTTDHSRHSQHCGSQCAGIDYGWPKNGFEEWPSQWLYRQWLSEFVTYHHDMHRLMQQQVLSTYWE